MASRELEVLEDYIVQNKLKITKQRRAVLNAFLECEKHVSAEELYNQVTLTDPKVGQRFLHDTIHFASFRCIRTIEHFMIIPSREP